MSQVKQEKRKLDLWDKPFQAGQNPSGQNQTRNPNQQRQATVIRPSTQNPLPAITPNNPVPNALIRITNPPAPNPGSTSTRGQRARIRVARSAASNNSRSEWRPSFNKAQIILRPYQASIIESTFPQNRTLHLNSQSGETLNIQSSVITGVPGSGLTLMLAKQALDLNSRGSSSILLARNDIQRSRIAQMILDHAPEAERRELAQRIVIIDSHSDMASINDASNKIIIASPQALNKILIDSEDDLPADGDQRRRDLELRGNVQRLLANIDNILVDDFHSYTGQVNDGHTETLIEVLKSSRGTDSNKLPLLLAVSSTPNDRGEVETNDPNPILNFEDFFSPLAHQYTPDYRELIDKHFLKNPQPLPITTALATDSDRLINEDKRNLLISVEPDSVNHQLVQIYQNHQRNHPGEKWRVIADTAEHANKLCRLFNAYGIQARTINHKHNGHFEQVENPTTPTNDDPNRINIGTSTQENIIQLEARRGNRQEILDDYNSGNVPVLIDCEILQGINDSNTDVIAHWNFSDSDDQLLRSLGISINPEARSQNIHWLALDPHNRRRLQYVFDNGLLDSNPFAPKGESSPSNPIDPIQSNDTIALGFLNNPERLSKGHAEWLEQAIKPLVEYAYEIDSSLDSAFNETIGLIVSKFLTVNGEGKGAEQLAQDLILGKRNSPAFIRNFIEFAQGEYNYDLSSASYRVPELRGIRNREELENSLKAIYPEVIASTASQALWLNHLDQEILKIPREANAEQRAKYRIEALATILVNLFVDKQSYKPFKRLEDGSTLNQAIRTFIGSGNNPKLLAMMMLDRDQDLRSLQTQFPGLLGTRNLIPFEKLKQNILARFPEMPDLTTDQKRKDFFLKTLYRETNIDYPALLDSSTEFFSTSAQPIIDSSIRAKIQKFLEEFYSNELSSTAELDARINTAGEVQFLADSHLNDLANELIYSQLIAKIWDKEENTIAMTKEGYFDLQADSIEAKPIHEPYEDRIDLLSANIEWVSLLNNQLKGLDETSVVNGLTKRMARSFQEFIKENRDLGIDSDRVVKVLSGATAANETSNEDREIFTKYLEFINLPRNEARRILPHLVEAQSYKDIQSAIEQEIKPNINASWQEHLQGLSSGENLSGLIADFIFDIYQNLFYDNENLRRVVNILAGDLTTVEGNEKARAENLRREFVEFINPTVTDTISRFPLLMGIHNREELIAAIQFPNRFELEYVLGDDEFRTDENVLTQVRNLGKELGLNIASMANIAQLPNPENFYGEGIAFGLREQKITQGIDTIRSSIAANAELIQARELLRTVFGDQYTEGTSINLFTIRSVSENPRTTFRTKIQGNKLIIESDSSIALNDPAESLEASITNSRAIEYENREGLWSRTETNPQSRSTNTNLGAYLASQNPEWANKLTGAFPDINLLAESMASFMAAQYRKDQSIPLTTLAKILAGNVETINENKADYSKIFRAWVTHLGMEPPMDLAGVAAEFPKLTGINNREELIAAFRANSNIEDFTKEYRSRSNEGAVAAVQRVADKLGLSLEEMRIAAGINNPLEFYAEPYRLINEKMKLSGVFSTDKLTLSDNDAKVLLSRELIRTVYGDEYRHGKTDPKPIISMWTLALDTDLQGELSIDSNSVNLKVTNPKNAGLSPDLEYVCKYENDQWNLSAASTWTEEAARASLYRTPGAQAKWIDYLLSKFSAIHIMEQMQAFLNQHPDVQIILPSNDLAANKPIYESLQGILCGNEAEIKKDPTKNTQLFRDWLAHLGMTTDEVDKVIAEFPRLTGVRDLREVRLAVHHSYPELNTVVSGIPQAKQNQHALAKVENILGINKARLNSLFNLPAITEAYREPLALLPAIKPTTIEFLDDDRTIRKIWDNVPPSHYNRINLSPEKEFFIALGNNICKSGIISISNDPATLFNASSFNYSPERGAFVLEENLSDTALKIESIYASKNTELLLDRRIKFIPFSLKAFGREDQAGFLLNNLIAEYLERGRYIVKRPDAEMTAPQRIAESKKIKEYLEILFELRNSTVIVESGNGVTEIANPEDIKKGFIAFATHRYPNFRTALEEYYASLGLAASPSTAAGSAPPAQTKSIIDRIRELHSYENFSKAIAGASDSGYAELCRIATSLGISFDELYKEAGLEEYSTKYNETLSKNIFYILLKESKLAEEDTPGVESHIKDYFLQDAPRLKALELTNAIWNDSKAHIKPLLRLQNQWYTIVIKGTDDIDLLTADGSSLTEAQTIDPKFFNSYTRRGKFIYNKETNTWEFGTGSPAKSPSSKASPTPPTDPAKPNPATPQTPAQIAIEAIKGKNKGLQWYTSLIETPAKILEIINKENNINVNWDDLLEFYGTNETQALDEVLGATTALGFNPRIESERIITIKILNKIFEAETKQRKFIDIPVGNIKEADGTSAKLLIKIDCIDCAKLVKKGSAEETTILKEVKLIDGQWIVQTPAQRAIEAIRKKGQDWYTNLVVNQSIPEILNIINRENSINVNWDDLLAAYRTNRAKIREETLAAARALDIRSSEHSKIELQLERIITTRILNEIFEERKFIDIPLSNSLQEGIPSVVSIKTNCIDHAKSVNKTSGKSPITLKEVKLIDGQWVVQEAKAASPATPQTPAQIAIEEIKSKGKEWWRNQKPLELVFILKNYLQKISNDEKISVDLNSLLAHYKLNKYTDAQGHIQSLGLTLNWAIGTIDDETLERTLVATILNKIFGHNEGDSIMIPIASDTPTRDGQKLSTNGIDYAIEEIEADGTTQVLREAKLINGRWVVQEPETQNNDDLMRQQIVKLLSQDFTLQEIQANSGNDDPIKLVTSTLGITNDRLFQLAIARDTQNLINNGREIVDSYIAEISSFLDKHEDLKQIREGAPLQQIQKVLKEEGLRKTLRWAFITECFEPSHFHWLTSTAKLEKPGPNLRFGFKRNTLRIEKYENGKKPDGNNPLEYEIFNIQTKTLQRYTRQPDGEYKAQIIVA